MSILFKNAQIIDPTADDVTTRDLMVRDGKIVDPSGKAETVIDCSGKYLAPGIVDIGVKVCEPGERHKESYKTAGAAAAAGGVTTIVTRADTDPAIDTPEALEFIRRRAAEVAPVNVLHIAALTKGRAGREMTEIGFLQDAGAVAFSDGYRVVQNTKVLARAMVYAKSLAH